VTLIWLLVFALLSAASAANTDAAQSAIEVSLANASEYLVKKVPPLYPPLAKQVRIQGKVKLRAVISKTGTVDAVNMLSGHPLLVQAAVDAVKQWRYKLFLVDGQPVVASTEIEVPNDCEDSEELITGRFFGSPTMWVP